MMSAVNNRYSDGSSNNYDEEDNATYLDASVHHMLCQLVLADATTLDLD
jgi:hypothetical protein